MISVYPQLRQAEVEYVWGGTLDFAFDIMPHAGKIDGMFYSVGYAGHGVAMATLLGQKIAQSILTGREISLLRSFTIATARSGSVTSAMTRANSLGAPS